MDDRHNFECLRLHATNEVNNQSLRSNDRLKMALYSSNARSAVERIEGSELEIQLKTNQKKVGMSNSKSTPVDNAQLGWNALARLIRSQPKQGITLVVGAGMHAVPKWDCPLTHEHGLLLSSWGALLDEIFPNVPASPSSSLRWELGLLQLESEDAAAKRSMDAFKRLQEKMQAAESAVLNHRCRYDPVKSVLKATCVQNIISLNVDLTVEQLLLKDGETLPKLEPPSNKTKTVGGKTKNPVSDQEVPRHLESCRKIGPCTIWHPHGDRASSNKSCFGLREYALRAQGIEIARCKFMEEGRLKKELKKPSKKGEPNWIDLVMETNLIFVGTSLDFSEWDLWFALVTRWRNYANPAKKQGAPQSFVLTTGDKHANLPSQITRLRAPSYDQGWEWLGAVMNCSTNSAD